MLQEKSVSIFILCVKLNLNCELQHFTKCVSAVMLTASQCQVLFKLELRLGIVLSVIYCMTTMVSLQDMKFETALFEGQPVAV